MLCVKDTIVKKTLKKLSILVADASEIRLPDTKPYIVFSGPDTELFRLHSFHEIKDISLYGCAAECSSDPEECHGIVYESLTNDCSVLDKTVADLGGKTPGLGGENMVYLRILNTIARGIVLGLHNAYPTFIHVLRKRFQRILCGNNAGIVCITIKISIFHCIRLIFRLPKNPVTPPPKVTPIQFC